ncbi:MAG: flagellar biosynthetic protein FliR [Bdellovibrionales bacterium]
MFEIYKFSESEILVFLLILARISAFLVTWPILSQTQVPQHTKLLLSLLLAFMVMPATNIKAIDPRHLEDAFILLIMKEVFVGIILGFLAKMFFYTIETCGHIVSDAIGLTNAQVLNPTSDVRSSVIEQFYIILVTVFFLLINGHHYFLTALFESFRLVPVSQTSISFGFLANSGEYLQTIMLMGLKFAAPVFASLFAMNIAMGVIGRAVPQMNVLITGVSVNILFGLFIMFISLPMILSNLPEYMDQVLSKIFDVLKGL